jgi:hypothetical protein
MYLFRKKCLQQNNYDVLKNVCYFDLMILKTFLLAGCIFISFLSIAQNESTLAKLKEIMEKAGSMPDTSAVPNDKLTAEIKALRKERKTINTNDVIKIKIAEERKKDKKLPAEFYDRLLNTFTNGTAINWVDNSIIRLYRQYFTEREIKELIKFYKTSAGKKWASNFPLIMIESVGNAETIMKSVSENILNDMKVEGKIK